MPTHQQQILSNQIRDEANLPGVTYCNGRGPGPPLVFPSAVAQTSSQIKPHQSGTNLIRVPLFPKIKIMAHETCVEKIKGRTLPYRTTHAII